MRLIEGGNPKRNYNAIREFAAHIADTLIDNEMCESITDYSISVDGEHWYYSISKDKNKYTSIENILKEGSVDINDETIDYETFIDVLQDYLDNEITEFDITFDIED